MSKVVEPQILLSSQSNFVTKDLQGNIVETKPTLSPFSNTLLVKSGQAYLPKLNIDQKYKQEALLDTKNQFARQQSLEEGLLVNNTPLTDRVFGKSESGFGINPQKLKLGAYIILFSVAGGYVAKSNKKSTILGMVVGAVLPLVAYQLILKYDRKKLMPKKSKEQIACESRTNYHWNEQSKSCMYNA
jgi:hypothetical protein